MTHMAIVVDSNGTERRVELPPVREPEKLDCGHMSTPTSVWTGYATRYDGAKVCGNCAADDDRANVRAGGILFAYVGTDGIHVNLGRRMDIITWAGVKLGTAVASHVTTDGLGNKVRYVTAVIEGVHMFGRHYPDAGDYIRLYPNKHQPQS